VSTIRKYCALACNAGVIPKDELERIQAKVQTISRKDALHINEKRAVKRVGLKKEHAVTLTTEQVERLFAACPDTPQGARDAFLLTLIFRYGFRCVEVAAQRVSSRSFGRRQPTIPPCSSNQKTGRVRNAIMHSACLNPRRLTQRVALSWEAITEEKSSGLWANDLLQVESIRWGVVSWG
jgi:integrase